MNTYIALLRSINVSGHRLIKMSDLRQTLESIGLTGVQTYIQSGNVLFRSLESAAVLGPSLEQEIERTFGFDVPVVIRTVAEMEQVVTSSPFNSGTLGAGESLHVSLLREAPADKAVQGLLASPVDGDEFQIHGREVYLLFRQPSHKSKLSNGLIEQRLRVAATTRNWQTITKLLELGKSLEQQ